MVVHVQKAGPVTTVILDRIHQRNAVDPETAEALTDAFRAFDADADASIAVLWGAGGAFCAGFDLGYAAGLTDEAAFEAKIAAPLAFPEDATPPPRGPMGPSRLGLSKPVIAAIEGPAVAGGMELALWADLRIMAEDAYFGVYCRRWGIPLIDGGTVRLQRLVGQGRAMEIILTGRKVAAEEAHRIGLCEAVVGRGEARGAAEAMASAIARFPQAAVRADRMSLYETQGLPVHEALRREWANGVEAFVREGARGAARFVAGKGRGGDQSDI